MRLVRCRRGGETLAAVLEGSELFRWEGTFTRPRRGGFLGRLEEVTLLAPVQPRKILAVGRNYREHIRELHPDEPVPEEPLIFTKPPTSVIGPGEAVVLPPEAQRVDYEGELALVVGRRCRRVSVAEVPEVLLGYTCLNDVTARDLQHRDNQWTRAKGFDTFCPLGPWVETDPPPAGFQLETRLNGKIVQRGHSREFIFSPAEVVAYISTFVTLEPGDVIATGTPAGVGPLAPGDEICVAIAGVGVLCNPVTAEKLQESA